MSDDCVNFIFENSAVPVIPSNTDSGTVLTVICFLSVGIDLKELGGQMSKCLKFCLWI